MLRVAVIGVGAMGSHHARVLSTLEGIKLVGVVDIDPRKAEGVAERYHTKAYTSYQDIISDVDAVTIAVPTTSHFEVARDVIRYNKDLFIEKPITTTIEEAETLVYEAEQRGLIMQVGHIERFNAGVSLINTMVKNPRFIESHRLSPFSGRGIDVDVTLDLMIHDIDIILTLVDSDISDVRATGASVITKGIDIARAWIEFENGCIAETVTSRVAERVERQLNVFQRDSLLRLDYQTQEVRCYRRDNDHIEIEEFRPEKRDPLREQLISFIECVKERKRPAVSGHEAERALRVALKVSEIVNDEGR